MSWDYRVLRRADGMLALREVYYDDGGRPEAHCDTGEFEAAAEEGIAALRDAVRSALEATNRPVLEESLFPGPAATRALPDRTGGY